MVARDIHGLAACHIVAEDVCGNVPHAQRTGDAAPLRRLMFVGAGFGMLLEKIGAPTFLWYSFGAAGLLALVIGVVYLLPLPLPRFADPYYQYLKRHGLLDATGKPLPDADIERILAEREDGIPPHA